MNAANTQAICALSRPRSLLMSGAACEMATRSMYWMIARMMAKTTTKYRVREGTPRTGDPGR